MKHLLLAAIGCALACVTPARADDLTDKGRAIYKKHQRSVVTVQLVLKSRVSMSGVGDKSNEARQTVTGTVLDQGGLTVVSLSASDPSQMMQSMLAGDTRFKVETELVNVRILLENGTDIPAEVVLRDKDLDLAFIRPTGEGARFEPVDLANAGTAEVLDQVIALNRLGTAAGRSYSASVERISAIVQSPRRFYVPDANMTTSTLGCPAFTLDGKLLGIFVLRALQAEAGAASSPLATQAENYTGIILPAADVARAMKQVPAPKQPGGERR